jgi:hypothetical protein
MKTTLHALGAVGIFCAALLAAPSAQAVIIDLTNPGTAIFPTASGPALFSTDFTQATGSGNFEAFLRVQADPTEQGYNTSTNKVLDNKDGAFTKDIRISDLAIVGDYYSFVIDINEANSPSTPEAFIVLDALKLFTTTTGGQSTTDINSLGTLVFDLDQNGIDSSIEYLDGNSGSGQADIAFLIPIAAFGNVSPDTFVVLYAQFNETNAGFEEFNIAPGIIVNIPEPTSFAPLACVLGTVIGSHRLRRRRRV